MIVINSTFKRIYIFPFALNFYWHFLVQSFLSIEIIDLDLSRLRTLVLSLYLPEFHLTIPSSLVFFSAQVSSITDLVFVSYFQLLFLNRCFPTPHYSRPISRFTVFLHYWKVLRNLTKHRMSIRIPHDYVRLYLISLFFNIENQICISRHKLTMSTVRLYPNGKN